MGHLKKTNQEVKQRNKIKTKTFKGIENLRVNVFFPSTFNLFLATYYKGLNYNHLGKYLINQDINNLVLVTITILEIKTR